MYHEYGKLFPWFSEPNLPIFVCEVLSVTASLSPWHDILILLFWYRNYIMVLLNQGISNL